MRWGGGGSFSSAARLRSSPVLSSLRGADVFPNSTQTGTFVGEMPQLHGISALRQQEAVRADLPCGNISLELYSKTVRMQNQVRTLI